MLPVALAANTAVECLNSTTETVLETAAGFPTRLVIFQNSTSFQWI